MKYGVRVQLFPDRTNGDGGLEAYVSAEQTAFQCYAPQDPLTVKAQTDGQKRKITDDIAKLVQKSKQTSELIGQGNAIKEWVLLTPALDDKAVLRHANTQSASMRKIADAHEWCHVDFRISAHTDQLFQQELNTLAGTSPSILALQTFLPPDFAPTDAIERESFEQVLQRKLVADPSLASSIAKREKYAAEILRSYYTGQLEYARIRQTAPPLAEAITAVSSLTFDNLTTSIVEADGRPTVVVSKIRDDLANRFTDAVTGISRELATLLARYYVASWWIQCPLEFDTDFE